MRLARFAPVALAATLAAGAGLFAGYTVAAQPHMQEALGHLEAAEAQLRDATHDKGGHRDRALELVQRAQREVREGMRFDRRH
jgi:hypothetical protein